MKLQCKQGELIDDIHSNGCALLPEVLSSADVMSIRSLVDDLPDDQAVRRRRGATYGVRNLFELCPALRELIIDGPVPEMAEQIIGDGAFVARAMLFDKRPDANWKVRWHQDAAIAVAKRQDAPGFGPWSEKAGVTHVRPPRDVLEGMITARIHLDDCDESNGALQIVPGSHDLGLLDSSQGEALRATNGVRTCAARSGDVLFMRPLILHASSPSTRPTRRRIVHLEFAATELPGRLSWHVA